jgi:hypothetical protein
MTEETLINELQKHFEYAGFVDSVTLMTDCDAPIPDGVLVMHNSYGLMVGLEVSGTREELSNSLKNAQEEMHDWIRKALLYLENMKGLIIDGYLLLILKQEPDIQTKEIIREIELDTKVCRKHVVWPIGDGPELDRLQFITVLSLPKPLSSNSIEKTSFELSAEAKALISEYTNQRSLDRVLDYIKQGGRDAN